MKEDIFSLSNIYRQYLNCRRRKRNTINSLKFEMRLEDNLLSLQEELKNRTYYPSRSVCFVTRRPKLREIFAADFRDRIVHHILVRYLEKIWERIFVYDSYACRKEKGNHLAVKRLRLFMRKISRNGRQRAYYLQLDIHSFFMSINKEILFSLIAKRVKNEKILWLLRIILFHDCTLNYVLKSSRKLLKQVPAHKTLFNTGNRHGIPIGNLTSQFFGNVYLNELDQFVKHTLKAKYYARYVDDFVLLHQDKLVLEMWHKEIEIFLREKLNLTLNPKRQVIKIISSGIDFLGYIVRPTHILCRRRVVNNLKERLEKYQRKLVYEKNGRKQIRFEYPVLEKALAVISSYSAHFKMANSHNLKNKLWERYSFLKEFFFYDGRKLRRTYIARYDFKTLAAQYGFFRHKYPRDLLFFEVGRFYELYGRDAKFAVNRFGLHLIKERRGLGVRCGFSSRQRERYFNLFMKKGGAGSITLVKEEDRYLSRIKKRVVAERWIKAGERND